MSKPSNKKPRLITYFQRHSYTLVSKCKLLVWGLCLLSLPIFTFAQAFKTAANADSSNTYYQPDYPLIFVSSEIKEQTNSAGGTSGSYKLGTDVLSANNPDGGNKLWLLLPNGETKLLFPLTTHLQQDILDTPTNLLDSGSVIEPNLSEDGKTVYFSYFHNADDKTFQSKLPKLGADLYSINLSPILANNSLDPARLIAKRLTFANVLENNELVTDQLYKDALNPELKSNGSHNWGTVYMHPEEMRTKYGLKLIYVSDKKRISNSNRSMNDANHNFNLYIADVTEDGSLKNHQQFQYYTTTSALSPNRLRNGIAFSYQGTTEDARHWQIQGLTSSGQWYPIFGYGRNPESVHLSTFCVKEKGNHPGDYLVATSYYNQNNNGFGALHSVMLSMAGVNGYDLPEGGAIVPRQLGAKQLTKRVEVQDLPAVKINNKTLGKFTTPRCGKADQLYFSHTPTSANARVADSDNNKGFYRAYIGYRNNLEPFDATKNVNLATEVGVAKVIEDATGERNLLWPLPVLSWQARTGDVEQTYTAPAVASQTQITAGMPFAEVGTSALWNTDRRPFDCWLGSKGRTPFSPNQAEANYNSELQELTNQSSGLNYVHNQQDFCEYLLPDNVLGIAINITSNKLRGSYGNYESANKIAKETSRLLGVYSVVNQADQSFKATIPANIPFDFHLLDRSTGLKLTDVRSWHSLQPEESRTDCGGCHQHEKAKAIAFADTVAATQPAMDMTNQTSYVDYDAQCQPEIKTSTTASIEPLEWLADIWPGLDNNCSDCHNNSSNNNLALTAFSYSNEKEAYDMLRKRNFISHTLGAMGSPAWWAARGQRTDGRDNSLEKYQANYSAGKWGFQHTNSQHTVKALCDGSSPENAKWVYKFGRWIDNHLHRDVGTGAYNTKLDRYHPTINSAITGATCTDTNLHVGWWDDSGAIKHMSVKINDQMHFELTDQDNGNALVPLGARQTTDSIAIEVIDAAGNRQNYEKSFNELIFECNVRLEGKNTYVTATPYSHENDYTDAETDIGSGIDDNIDDPIGLPEFNPDTDTATEMPADINIPLDDSIYYASVILPISADTTLSQYNVSEQQMNFGGADELRTYTGQDRHILMQADLSTIPSNKPLLKAQLNIYVLGVNYPSYPMLLAYQVTRPWTEGTQAWSSTPDGVTWLETDFIDHNDSVMNDWSHPGGDIDTQLDHGYGNNGLIKRAHAEQGQWLTLDITSVLQVWKNDPQSNFGLLLRGIMREGNALTFASREAEDPRFRPYVEYFYQEEVFGI